MNTNGLNRDKTPVRRWGSCGTVAQHIKRKKSLRTGKQTLTYQTSYAFRLEFRNKNPTKPWDGFIWDGDSTLRCASQALAYWSETPSTRESFTSATGGSGLCRQKTKRCNASLTRRVNERPMSQASDTLAACRHCEDEMMTQPQRRHKAILAQTENNTSDRFCSNSDCFTRLIGRSHSTEVAA